jgi:hypothetical protein
MITMKAPAGQSVAYGQSGTEYTVNANGQATVKPQDVIGLLSNGWSFPAFGSVTALLAANNLDDLADVPTALLSLGLGTAADSTDFATAAQGAKADTALQSAAAFTKAPVAAPGTAGTCAYDATHVYVCVATDTWVRADLATWA